MEELCEARDPRTRRVAKRAAADLIALVAAFAARETMLLAEIENVSPERAKRLRAVLARTSAETALSALRASKKADEAKDPFDAEAEIRLPGVAAELEVAHRIIASLRLDKDASIQSTGDQLSDLLQTIEDKSYAMIDALAKKANEAEEKQDRLKRRTFDKLSEGRKSNKNQGGDPDAASSGNKSSSKRDQDSGDEGEGNSDKKDDRWANRNRNGKGKRPMPHDYEVQEDFIFPDECRVEMQNRQVLEIRMRALEARDHGTGGFGLGRVRADLKPIAGTRLIREWQGVEHTATVLDDGYEWQARPYQSLSAVA